MPPTFSCGAPDDECLGRELQEALARFVIDWTTCGTDKSSGCMRVFVFGCGQVYAAILDLYNKGAKPSFRSVS